MISVVVLTFNEEDNLRFTLEALQDFPGDIHVVDSYSTDSTLDIASDFNVAVHQNAWDGWAAQRNWAQENCSLAHPWVLYLDADEIMTEEAQAEILERVRNASSETAGFYLQFEFWFLGHKISRAMVPHLRLVDTSRVHWIAQGAREYNTAPKDSPVIQARLIHRDNRDLMFWATSFIKKAHMESQFVYDLKQKKPEWGRMFKNREIKALVRTVLSRFLPPFIRVLPFFFYRMIFSVRLRDGWPAIQYNILISLWYPLLVECFLLEKRLGGNK